MERRAPGLLLLAMLPLVAMPPGVVIDTDAGSDDLIAIAFLLSRMDVRVESIHVVHGLAHVPRGAENIRKLLGVAGREDIPVYLGREEPLQKTNEFPAAWRKTTDELLTGLPMARSKPVKEDSVAYYSRRKFAETTVLALGPLTNLAAAIGKGARFSKIVLMGGAVRVPGNLGDGGYFKTDNKTAEWNIFCDPKAAGIVFSSGAEIRMVPLDVTNQVPVTETFLNTFRAEVRSALGRLVGEILERDRTVIREGIYYAWDPLAAAGLVDDAVVRWRPLRIAVKSDGTTAETAAGGTVVSTALYADPLRFRHLLIQALQ